MKNLPDVISDTYHQISLSMQQGGRSYFAPSPILIEVLEKTIATDMNQLWAIFNPADRHRCLTVMQACNQSLPQWKRLCQDWTVTNPAQISSMEAMLALQFIDRQLISPSRRDGEKVLSKAINPLLQILLSGGDWQYKTWALEWMNSNRNQNYQNLKFPMAIWDQISSQKRHLQKLFKQLQQGLRQ